jgi:hypothetical protein
MDLKRMGMILIAQRRRIKCQDQLLHFAALVPDVVVTVHAVADDRRWLRAVVS